MRIDQLPDEILSKIFRYIDDLQQRGRLERVCRQWRKIILDDGWTDIRKCLGLHKTNMIEAISMRCGGHLVDCSFDAVDIDSTLVHLIAEQFPKLKHLNFNFCQVKELDETALESFRGLGTRLRSLNFYQMDYTSQLDTDLSRLFPRLQHLGLHLPYHQNIHAQVVLLFSNPPSQHPLPSHFPMGLRSLYLGTHVDFSQDLDQLLTNVQRDSPMLAALFLENAIRNYPGHSEPLLNRISDMKNLRLLRIAFSHDFSHHQLCACLNKMSQLIGLQLNLPIQHLSDVFRSLPFRGLVHLSLSLNPADYNQNDFKPIGLLTTFAPHLRSLSLNIPSVYSLELEQEIISQVLTMAYKGILEYLNVSYAAFTIGILDQLIRLCPDLHTIAASLLRNKNEQIAQIYELRHVVADQWRAGTRKHLPLRVWIYGHQDICWSDSFLTIHIDTFGVAPPNPVLNALFRDEIFNDDAGTPSFVAECYSANQR